MSSKGYKLNSNERFIRSLIRYPNDLDFERIRTQLLAGAWKLSNDGKWWVQDGMRRSYKKIIHFIKEQKRKAKLGAKARWDAHGHNPAMPEAMHGDALSCSVLSSSILNTKTNTAQPQRDFHQLPEQEQKRQVEAKEKRLAERSNGARGQGISIRGTPKREILEKEKARRAAAGIAQPNDQ
jgi:hypothetical protein